MLICCYLFIINTVIVIVVVVIVVVVIVVVVVFWKIASEMSFNKTISRHHLLFCVHPCTYVCIYVFIYVSICVRLFVYVVLFVYLFKTNHNNVSVRRVIVSFHRFKSDHADDNLINHVPPLITCALDCSRIAPNVTRDR